jgi:hypothetical protein
MGKLVAICAFLVFLPMSSIARDRDHDWDHGDRDKISAAPAPEIGTGWISYAIIGTTVIGWYLLRKRA